MLGRTEIVTALEAEMPEDVDVIPYARNIAAPDRSTVMVRIDAVKPSKIAGALWDVTGALVLIAAQTTPGPADDELDGLLQDVLYALGRPATAAALSWTEATRATYGEPDPTNPAYEVTVTTSIQKEL